MQEGGRGKRRGDCYQRLCRDGVQGCMGAGMMGTARPRLSAPLLPRGEGQAQFYGRNSALMAYDSTDDGL